MRRMFIALAGFCALVLGGAAPAVATGGDHPPAPKLEWSIEESCGSATVTFTNNTKYPFWGDVKVDDQAPTQDEYGDIYTLVEVPANSTIEHVVTLDEDSGKHEVAARWARGPESDWYDPTDWKSVEVYTDCSPAKPVVAQPTCEDPQGHITIPEQDKHRYTIEGKPVAAGDHERVPGSYLVEAYRKYGSPKPIISWVLTINPPPTEEECNPPGGEDGSEEGTEDGTDAGTEEGSEEGTEEGAEDGTDDGAEDGSEVGSDAGDEGGTPTPTPTDPPTGDEDGADDGTDDGDELPDTGSNPAIIGLGVGLMLLGGLAYFVTRHRRKATI